MTTTEDVPAGARNPDLPAGLTLPPEGVRVYTKVKIGGGSGRRLVTLFYRLRDASRQSALDFPGRVLEDLASAGVSLRGEVTIKLALWKGGPRYGCIVEVPITTGE